MIEKWYAKPIDSIADMLGTSTASGLSPKAARARLREEGENDVFALPRTASLTYAAYVVSDVSMLFLVLTAILAAVWGHGSASTLILCVLALHCVAAIFTYIKSRRIFESMAVCAMPRVRVLRGGRVFAVDARLVVRGDVILLRPGDVIPCDARLCTAEELEVLEYSGKLNGKSQRGRAVKEAGRVFNDRGAMPIGEQTNMVFAGSVVLAGQGSAIVVETGADTFLVSTEGQIPLIPTRDRLPALEALKKHCGRTSLFMLVLILPLTVMGLFIPGELNLLDYFLLALSLAVSSMSELTAAIGYIIVGCGVLRAARSDADGGENAAILPYLSDLPALARMDTLVLLDDTALTEGKIAVTAAFRGTEPADLDGEGDDLCELFETALIASGLPGGGGLAAAGSAADPAQTALIDCAAAHGVKSADIRDRLQFIDYAPVGSGNPFATALIEEQRAPYAVCCGDAAVLLGRCTRAVDPSTAGGTCMLRRERREALLAACAAETAAGGYAVAYARRSSPYNTLQRLSVLQDDLILIGVLVFRDPLGAGVPEAVEVLAEAGVRTVLMADRPTGGGSIEVLARAAGILREGVICRAPAPIPDNAELCIGYGGADRRAYLEKLREAGAVTVGLGARIADLASMQNCSVAAACTPVKYGSGRESRVLESLDPASGAYYGTELLKKNAGLLIRRPGVRGGGVAGVLAARQTARRIEANLASALRCLLSSQTMRIAAVILLLVLRLPAVTPLQLLFGGLILDFGAILVCAFDRGEDRDTSDDFFTRPLRSCLPYLAVGALCGAGTALTPWILLRAGVLSDAASASGFVFLSMVLTQLVLLFACRRDAGLFGRSRIGLLWPLCELIFAVLCFVWPAPGAAFSVTALPTAGCICLVIAPLIALFGGEIIHALTVLQGTRDEFFPEDDGDDQA